MPVTRARAPGKQPPTSSADDAYEEILKHIAVAVRFELSYRRGGKSGRFRLSGWEYTIANEDERDTTTIFGALIDECDALNEREGSCKFQLRTVVMQPGEAEKHAPPVTFRTDEDEDGADSEAASVMREMGRGYKEAIAANGRMMGQLEKATGMVVKMAETITESAGPAIEMAKLKYEHDRWTVEQEGAAEEYTAEMNMMGDLLGKALIVTGARKAAKDLPDDKPAWEHAVDIAGQVRTRDALREALGQDGADLLDAVAAATSQQEVEGPMIQLKLLVKSGAVKLDAVLAAAPELLPFASFLG